MPTPIDLLKPYLWLAAVGFAVGFLGYVAAQPARTEATVELPSGWVSTASAPSFHDRNFPKRI